MLAMVCWMILHTGMPYCSAPVTLPDAIRIHDSLNADTSGSDVGPAYVVRQGSDMYRVAVIARNSRTGYADRWSH